MDEQNSVVSSRIRLARNIEKINMPVKISYEDAKEVERQVRDSLKTDDMKLNFYKIEDFPKIDLDVLVEKRIISKELIEKPEISSFLVSDDEEMTVMINEEDHIRIQVIKPGFNLWEAWNQASMIDDILDNGLNYAYDRTFGYLTTCLTNTGTGLRASIMVHLPFLTASGQIDSIASSVGSIGVVIRGYYGEGSSQIGGLYQISNQLKSGGSEEDIIRKMEAVVHQIIYRELLARNAALEKSRIKIEDRIFRSYGILKNARLLGIDESMDLLSDLRIGASLGVIDITKEEIDGYTVMTQNPNIVKSIEYISAEEVKRKRADIFREVLK